MALAHTSSLMRGSPATGLEKAAHASRLRRETRLQRWLLLTDILISDLMNWVKPIARLSIDFQGILCLVISLQEQIKL